MATLKLGLFSDVHAHRYDQSETIEKLVEYINSSPAPDLIILAGDVSHRSGDLRKFFSSINLTCPKLWTPGNHDIWVVDAESPDDTAETRYTKTLPKISKETGWHYLPGHPYAMPDVGLYVVGCLGWFTGRGYSEWFDAPASERDDTIARRMAIDLRADIAKTQDDSSLIIVTHHLLHHKCMTTKDFRRGAWNEHMLELVKENSGRITLSIHGHIHRRYGPKKIEGIRTMANPFGYPHQHNTHKDGYRVIELEI